MDCVQHETPLREHAHGAPLSPALEAHLASCAGCQEVVAAEQRLLSEIDRALDGVGRVEPSPTFIARARAVALERPPRSQESERLPTLGWPIWALSALAGAVLIAALVARTRPSPVERAPIPPAASPSSSPKFPSREPRLPTASRETVAAMRHSFAHPSSEPTALVPPGQADALVRLAALIDAGSVAPPAMLLEPPDPDQELRPPADLHLRPLAIEPIVRESADNEGDTL